MQLQTSKKNIKTGFNMASMTDIIFLLLLFFLLTSTYITSESISINIPQSNYSKQNVYPISLTITKDLTYFLEKEEVPYESLEKKIKEKIKEKIKPTLALRIDKNLPIQNMIQIASLTHKLRMKMAIITVPEIPSTL